MKEIYSIDELIRKLDFFTEKALSEIPFIYPTDTIYGIGGIVTKKVIGVISSFKNRTICKKYSIIAPSFKWIDKHCILDYPAEKLWGKYIELSGDNGITLLLQWDPNCGFDFPLLTDNALIGVRILNHSFQNFVKKLGQPFITTSCNVSGEETILSTNQISDKFEGIIIDGGTLVGTGSTIFDTVTGERIR